MYLKKNKSKKKFMLNLLIELQYIYRSINVGNGVKRQSMQLKKIEKLPSEKVVNERRKKRISQRRKCDDETANLNRVLVERMLLKNSGFNQGSRSVGGTPICLRRKKHDLNKNFSPIKHPSDTGGLISPRQFLVEKKAAEIVKRRSNSVRHIFQYLYILFIYLVHTFRFSTNFLLLHSLTFMFRQYN